MPEEKKQELENAKRVVKKKHEGETEDGYLQLVALMIAWCVEEESLEVEYCRFTWKKRKVSQ